MRLLAMKAAADPTILNPRARRHLEAVRLAAGTILLGACLTLSLAVALALAVAIVATAAAALLFMTVNPSGNLLLLVLLTHLWLLYARPEEAKPGHPRGGHTIRPEPMDAPTHVQSRAA